MSNVSHLECARCAKQFEPGKVYNLCPCGGPLLVRYDLHRVSASLPGPDGLKSQPPTLWRYRAVLPVSHDSSIVTMGEGFTPLVHAAGLSEKLGLPNLYFKDESRNPTGSFKARGLAVALSMARELGIKKVAIPSAGNAAGALAAYAGRWYRTDRDVESVRGNGTARVDRDSTAPDVRRASDRVRSHRARLRRRG